MGGKESSVSEKFKTAGQKSQKDINDMMNNLLDIENEKLKKERNEDMKYNLTIRIYSDKKFSQKYKDYLNCIIMKEWNIIYLDEGFSKD